MFAFALNHVERGASVLDAADTLALMHRPYVRTAAFTQGWALLPVDTSADPLRSLLRADRVGASLFKLHLLVCFSVDFFLTSLLSFGSVFKCSCDFGCSVFRAR